MNNNKNINDYLNCIDIIYWINLDRSEIRRTNMTKLLSTINIPSHRIIATDGKNISDNDLYKNFSHIQKYRSKIEYACLLSHLNSIKIFTESSNNIALILEDDISLEYLQYWNKNICQIINEAPPDWEIIMLNYVSKTVLVETYTLNQSDLINCCQSYLINKKGAKKIIDSIYKNNIFNLDDTRLHTSDNYIYGSLITYTYKYPYFTYPINNDSTIHESHLDFHNLTKSIAFVSWEEYYNLKDKNIQIKGSLTPLSTINTGTIKILVFLCILLLLMNLLFYIMDYTHLDI